MSDKKVCLSSDEIDSVVATIIDVEKNFINVEEREFPEGKKRFVLHNRQMFRRNMINNYDDISLYTICNMLEVYRVTIGLDVSFFTDFIRRSLYNRVVLKDDFTGVESKNVESLLMRASNLIFEYCYGDKISPYDSDEQLSIKLESVRRFGEIVVGTCNLDEIRTLIQKFSDYKNRYPEDSVITGYIETDLIDRISMQVVDNYFRDKSSSYTKLKHN